MERSEHSEALVLHERDPLLQFLTARLKLSLLTIVGLAVAVGVISIFGVGAVVSYLIHKEANIFRVFDPEHLHFALVAMFVNTPLIWLVYVWQPRGIVNTLDSLRQNNVIVETKEDSIEAFIKTMKTNLDSSRLSIAAALAVLFFILVQTLVVFPTESRQLGKPYFWFYDKRYYFLVFVPVLSLSYYAVAMAAIKGILALVWFNLLFRRFQARVHPLHPDEGGGFGALGSLAVKYSLIAVGLGAMAATLTVVRILIGSGWAHMDLLALYALYIVLTPISLVSPLWSAHQAMVRARNEFLHDISNEFEKILVEGKPQDWESLGELKARYTFIRETYPTWPISFAIFRRFSITASLPLITGVASILIDVITRSVAGKSP